PFNFESEIVLKMEENQTRRALVYMNTPLRHAGKTFYQYQMNKAADYTVFQVVRNPSWLVPYIACILVSIGLLWQFSFHLLRFLTKSSKAGLASS
ncbi:MAG: ResB protein required for cytochrome C biosynthesis, partial [Opitutales bacterium]